MKPTSAEVRSLLLSTGLPRPQIAKRLQVSLSAVDMWLASDTAKHRRQIPKPTWELAKILFGTEK